MRFVAPSASCRAVHNPLNCPIDPAMVNVRIKNIINWPGVRLPLSTCCPPNQNTAMTAPKPMNEVTGPKVAEMRMRCRASAKVRSMLVR